MFADDNRWWAALERRFLPEHVWEADLLTFWRERILFVIVFTATVVGLFALIPSAVLSVMERRWDILFLDFAVYGGALTILFGRRMPLTVRAWVTCSIFYCLGIGLLLLLGHQGAGYIWLFGASVMAGLLMGLRAGLRSLLLNFLSLLAVGWFIARFHPDWSRLVENPVEKWLVMTANFTVINALVTVTIALMLRGLERALSKEQEIARNLRRTENRFRLIVDNLPILIVGQDPEGRLVLWNKACERATGYTAEEMLHPGEADLPHRCASLMDVGEITDGESPCRSKRGEKRTVAWTRLGEVVPIPGLQTWAAGVDVTERKRAENELQASRAKYQIIFDNATEGILVIQNGLFRFANRKAAELVGWDVNNLGPLAKTGFMDWVHPEDREIIAHRHDRSRDGEAHNVFSFRIINQAGKVIWVEISSTVITWENQPATLTFMNEITERKEAENLLRESENRFKEMADLLPTIIVEIDLQGNLTYSNQAGFRTFGYTPEDLKNGLHITDVVVPADLPKIMEVFQTVIKNGTPTMGGEYRFSTKDGHEIYCFSQTRPMISQGEIVGARASLMNITDFRHARLSLEASEERYRTILDSIQEGYFEVDTGGTFTFFNKGFRSLLGYSEDELGGMHYRRIMGDDTALEANRAFNEVYETGRPSEAVDWSLMTKSGEVRQVETSLSLIRSFSNRPVGFRGIARDVTQRKQVQEMERRRAAAEAASEAKTEFLARMSHEIRTPLNAVIGMTELAMQEELSSRQGRIFSTINSEAEALMHLVNGILDFSKIEARKLEIEAIPFDLIPLVESIAESMTPEANKKGLELILSPPSQLSLPLIGDPNRLRQVLTNLLGNAIKFTHQGEVLLEVRVFSRRSNQADLVFKVKDTGIGIAKEKLATIFDAFTQADGSTTRHYGGTGLGTTISKKLVELMGGKIGAESRPGEGSTFWFNLRLPRQEKAPEVLLKPCREFKGLKILVLDDNSSCRGVLAETLRSWECEPMEAAGADDALRNQVDSDGGVSAILADLATCLRSGRDLPMELKSRPELKNVPMIALTHVGYPDHGLENRQELINATLTKPVRRDQLYRALCEVLGMAPECTSPDALPEAPTHPESEVDRSQIRVLVVEDYPTNQTIVREHLASVGYRVDLVENGRRAVDAFREHRFDLVLMDIQMPVMDGYEAVALIRGIENEEQGGPALSRNAPQKRTPIVAMTAHAFKGYREKCLRAGMDDYITKPIRRTELLEMVDKWTSTSGSPFRIEVPSLVAEEEPRSQQVDEFVVSPSKRDPADEEPPLDWKRACEEFMGKEDLLLEVIKEFMQDVKNQINRMREALDLGNSAVVAKEAHSIKGGAANLTAGRLAEAAHSLELKAKEGECENLHRFLDDLVEAFEQLRRFISSGDGASGPVLHDAESSRGLQ